MTASPATASPGDHLLHAIAARLLAQAGPATGFPLRPYSAPQPGLLAADAEGFGDVIAALQEPAQCPRSARCPGSSPRCAPACT